MNRAALSLGLVSISLMTIVERSHAQLVIPDATMSTIVNSTNNRDFTIINGSTSGTNLFHSFREFSVPAGGSATFDLANTANVSTIFSRVTGNTISSIDGLIRMSNSSTPVSLFLLNPNGIIFGKDARLDIGGSFVTTTANSIKFADGIEYSATNPTPLLTISAPVGLQFGSTPGQIINRSIANNNVGLQVPSGKSIVLAGGEIRLEAGRLRALSGQIELASVAGAGTIDLSAVGNDLRLSVPSTLAKGNILLSTAALANVSGTPGGRIAVNAANLNLTGGSLLLSQISGAGAPDSRSGNIEVDVSDTINITGASGIINRVLANTVGNAGNLNIRTGSLLVKQGSFLVTNTRGRGNAGQMNIQATNAVSFDGVDLFGNPSLIFTGVNAGAIGNGGTITIKADSLSVTNGAYLASSTLSRGNAGMINLQTRTTTFSGQDAKGNSSFLSSAVAGGGIGTAGTMNIKTDALFVAKGAFLSTATLGKGNGAAMNINANTVRIDGAGASGAATFLTSAVNDPAVGDGGEININANSVSVTNGALVTTVTEKSGSAGDIRVNANTLDVLNGGQILSTSYAAGKAGTLTFNIRDRITIAGSDPTYSERSQLPNFLDAFSLGAASGLFASTNPEASGAGGDLRIQTRELLIQEGAQVSVSSLGTGNAGNLIVNADSIRLNNGSLRAESRGGPQGNINLNAENIVLRQGSNITTDATGLATGGNISITAPVILGLENSDIIANAISGRGGNINITTQGIIGLAFRDTLTPRLDPTNDITASSQFDINGTVQVNNVGVDPNSGLVELAANLIDNNQQTAQGCSANQGSSFVITGRGGVPQNPSQQVSLNRPWADLRSLSSISTAIAPSLPASNSLIEATSWHRNPQSGKIELIAPRPVATSASATCAVSPT